jgi:hypothetical protein
LLYLPALVVGVVLVNTSALVKVDFNRGIADAVIVLGVSAIWYFFVARIPNAIMIRNVRRQVPTARFVTGVSCASVSGRPLKSEVTQSTNVFVATSSGIELWGGTGDNARPLLSANWSAVRVRSSIHGTKVELQLDKDDWVISLNVFSSRVASPLKVRGRALATYAAMLSSLGATVSK